MHKINSSAPKIKTVEDFETVTEGPALTRVRLSQWRRSRKEIGEKIAWLTDEISSVYGNDWTVIDEFATDFVAKGLAKGFRESNFDYVFLVATDHCGDVDAFSPRKGAKILLFVLPPAVAEQGTYRAFNTIASILWPHVSALFEGFDAQIVGPGLIVLKRTTGPRRIVIHRGFRETLQPVTALEDIPAKVLDVILQDVGSVSLTSAPTRDDRGAIPGERLTAPEWHEPKWFVTIIAEAHNSDFAPHMSSLKQALIDTFGIQVRVDGAEA